MPVNERQEFSFPPPLVSPPEKRFRTPLPRLQPISLPLHWFVRHSLTTTKWLNEAGLPILILHSKADTTIPFSLAMELHDSLRVRKRLFISEKAAHCGIQAVEGERYYHEVIEFASSGSP